MSSWKTQNHISTNMSMAAKKLRTSLVIGTHSGAFHCDEALACFLLRQLPEYADATIRRTRNQAELDSCDIVVDVGGVFDTTTHRYDHHQREFKETMSSLEPEKPWTTRLSSAGLVYKHFGRRVITKYLPSGSDLNIVEEIFDRVYEGFIEEIDGVDNGVNVYDVDIEPKYIISTTLSNRVKRLNPSWNEENPDEMAGFESAMALTGKEFLERVDFLVNSWLPAREIIAVALKERYSVNPSGAILKFSQGGCPWKSHLYELEKTEGFQGEIKYVLYNSMDSSWRIQCVSVNSSSFTNRLSLPEEWRGLRDEALDLKTGIAGCVFVHASGFIGGNKTYEGALAMARKALE